MAAISPLSFLAAQVGDMHPLNALLWIPGLGALLFWNPLATTRPPWGTSPTARRRKAIGPLPQFYADMAPVAAIGRRLLLPGGCGRPRLRAHGPRAARRSATRASRARAGPSQNRSRVRPSEDPRLPGQRLTLRAVPIATRVVRRVLVAASLASIYVAAHYGGGALRDVGQDTLLLRREPSGRRGWKIPAEASTRRVGDKGLS
jgi:hypothetical protein